MRTIAHILPDGSTVQVPANATFEEAEAIGRKLNPDAYKSTEKPKGGFFSNLGAGARSAVSTTGLGIGSLVDEDTARQAYRADQAAEQARGIKTVGLEDVKNAYREKGLLGAAAELPAAARDTLAQSLPYMAPGIAGSLAGAKAGAALSPVLGPLGPLGGAALGGMAAMTPVFFGSNLARQDQEAPAQQFDKSAALAAAIPQAGMDAAANLLALGPMLKITKLGGVPIPVLAKASPEVAKAKLVQSAQQSLLAATGKGAVVGAAAEIPTEVAQQVLERAQAGLPLLDASALKEYEESAFGAAVAGAPVGGVAGGIGRSQAKGFVRREEADAATAQRAADIEKERASKEAEAARKKTPEYALEVEKQYTEGAARIKALQEQIKALGKPEAHTAEAVEKKRLQEQIKTEIAAFKPVAEEYASKKGAIAVAKEQARVAGMTPFDYQMEQTGEFKQDSAASKKPFTTEEYNIHPEAVSPAQQYTEQQINVGRQLDNGTFQEKDYAELLLKDPKMAAQVVAERIRIPGFDKKQNDAIHGMLKLNLQEQARQVKAQRQQELEQANQDLTALATQATKPTTPDTAAQVQEEQDALRAEPRPAPTSPEYEKEDLSFLDNLLEKALNKEEGQDTVKVPETVKPDAKASQKLLKLNELQDAIEAANTKIRQAPNGAARAAAALEKERLQTTYNNLTKEATGTTTVANSLAEQQAIDSGEPLTKGGGAIAEVISRRQKQDETLSEIGSILEDLRYGITLDNVAGRAEAAARRGEREGATPTEQGLIEEKTKADLQGLATGTTKTLNDKIKQLKQQYISAAIEEAAINRRLYGKTLTKAEALQAARDIRAAFDEWVQRTQALPRSAVEERRAYDRRLRDDKWLEKAKQAAINQAVRDALINKAAIVGKEGTEVAGKPTQLTQEEYVRARNAGIEAFNKSVEGALPKGPRYEGRGTERKMTDRGRREAVDPRDLEERPLGAYEAATEVLKEQIRKATGNLTRVPEGKLTRETNLLKPQYAEEEARKVAEQKGETAKTEAGRIRRLVEYTTNLIEKALTTRGAIPPVRRALERAQDALDSGNTSEKLMDAAGTLANRIINGQKERTQNDALVREINDAVNVVEETKTEDQTKQGDLFGQEHLGFFRANVRNFLKALDTSPEVRKAKEAIKKALANARRATEQKQAADKLADILRREKESDKLVADKIAIREAVLTPEIKAEIEQAQDKVEAASKWLVDLEKKLVDLRKNAYKIYDYNKLRKIIGPEAPGRDTVPPVTTNKEVNAQIAIVQKQIDAETARLEKGRAALDKIEDTLNKRADRIYASLVAQREGQALAANKVEGPKKTNLQKLEERVKTALDKRLDLPGRIVEKGKVVEEVGSATNDAIAAAQDERATARRYAEELHQRKEALNTKKERILTLAERIAERTNDLREMLVNEAKPKLRKQLQEAIAENVREIQFLKGKAEAQKLTTAADWEILDEKRKLAIRRARERIASAKRTGKLGAPTTMRTGTPESKAVTSAVGEKKTETRLNKPTRKVLEAASEAMAMERSGEAAANLEEDLKDAGLDFGAQDTLFGPVTDLPAPTVKQLNAAYKHPINGMTFSNAGQWLVSNTTNPIQKALAQKVWQYLKRVPGQIQFDATIEKDGHVALYNPVEKRIYLSPRLVGNPQLQEQLQHELTHAATLAGMMHDPILRKQIQDLHAKVKEWVSSDVGQKYLREHDELFTGDNEIYGLQDEAEFVSEAFSNRAFQDMLKEIPSDTPTKSIWDRFLQYLARLFGANSPKELGILADVIEATEQLMKANTQAYRKNRSSPEGIFYGPKVEHADSAIGDAYTTMVGKPDTLNKFRENFLGTGFRVRFVDAYAGIKEALKTGDSTKAIQVAYDLMNFSNRNHFVQQAVTMGTPVRKGGYKVRGADAVMTEIEEGANLVNVAKHLGKVKGLGNTQAVHEAFTLYALAKRAADPDYGWERIFGDIPVPKTKDASPAQLAEISKENKKRAEARARADALLNDPEIQEKFKDAYNEYQAWNKGMLRFAMQSGVISEEEYRRLSAKGNYTPAFRADKNGNLVLDIGAGRDITAGKLSDEAVLEQLRGGSGQVMDFFKASVMNASVIMDASLNNIASREAAFALQAMGLAHPVSDKEKGPNIIEFRVKGEKDRQRFAINTEAVGVPTDLVVKGFAGVPASLPGMIRLLGAPAQLLRRAVTRNPLYMARQLVRDPMAAWLVTGADMNPVTDTFKELRKALSGMSDKTLDKRGVTGGMLFAENDTDLERIKVEAESASPWTAGYWMAKLDHAALAADALTRRNVYNGAIKEGLSEMEATLAAWESMPFSKRGTSPSMRMANHLIPFLSATIQGWDTLYRAMRNDMPLAERVDIRNKLLARAALIGGLTMLYAAGMEDDEAYKNANDQERLMNWFIRVPGMDNPIKVPVPFELGIFAKMIPEALYRSMASDKDFGDEMSKVLKTASTMIPTAIPQAASPIIEALANHSFFSDAPIESRALQGLDIGERADHKTSELSKLFGFDFELFGKQFGVSPKMLDYMLSQYTAGLYGAFAAIIDNVLPAPSVAKPDRTLAELPLFRSALLQEDSGGEVNRLYEKAEQLTRASRTFKKLAESNPDRAREYLEENRQKIVAGDVAEKMRAAIDKFAAIENKIRSAPMGPTEKKEALDRVKAAKTQMARQLNVSLASLEG